MKILTTISALFIIGGSAGWLIELIFRRMAHGKWINPGFLCGPCLPLYGTGVLVLYGFCNIDLSFIPQIWLRKVFLIIALTVVLTVIEYITGIVFVKFFHACKAVGLQLMPREHPRCHMPPFQPCMGRHRRGICTFSPSVLFGAYRLACGKSHLQFLFGNVRGSASRGCMLFLPCSQETEGIRG